MGDDLGAVDEDVPFDWDGADRLATQFDTTATTIDDQRKTRIDAGNHALIDWTGPYAVEFVGRQNTGDSDAAEIAGALRQAAEQVRAMKRLARDEQNRRIKAREYIKAFEENERNENFGDKAHDFFFGEDFDPPPKPPPPISEPSLSAPPGSAADRA